MQETAQSPPEKPPQKKKSTPLDVAKEYFGEQYPLLLQMDKIHQEDADIPGESLREILLGIRTMIKKRGRDIKTHQLRNIYSLIKEIEPKAENLNQFLLIQPKLTYISARQGLFGAKVITEFISDLIWNAQTDRHMKSIQTIMESIIAYHKFHHPNSK